MAPAASMQLGMVGLGRMGANIVRRLMRAGHECVVYDRDLPSPKPLPMRARSARHSICGFRVEAARAQGGVGNGACR